MKLSALIAADIYFPPEWDKEFNHIVCDSRLVEKGDLFIAKEGVNGHGRQYIDVAIERGAIAVFVEDEMFFECKNSKFFEQIPVFYWPEVKQYFRTWLERRYDISEMQLFAVTGTNGKSSVSQYIAQLAALGGHSCGVLGTLGNGIWPVLKPTANTTADLPVIMRDLADFKQQNVSYAALEISSHGLAQKRVAGLKFAAAVMTNLSQDHLDFHGTMENYFAAKRTLFTSYDINTAIINIDDDYGIRLYQNDVIHAQKLSYGRSEKADISYRLLAFDQQGIHAEIKSPWGVAQLILPLIGEFNLANACAAIAALSSQGWDFNALCQQAKFLQPVAGRMELYRKENAPLAVIDFAHTPDALRNVLGALKPWQRPLTTVYGCGGDRDRAKRPLMTQAVAEFSDLIWLTDDNPRTENPDQIFQDAQVADVVLNTQHDRGTAIAEAIAATASHGIVLIAGKGHEPYQDINGVKHPYNDANVLKKLGYQAVGGQHA